MKGALIEDPSSSYVDFRTVEGEETRYTTDLTGAPYVRRIVSQPVKLPGELLETSYAILIDFGRGTSASAQEPMAYPASVS